MLTGLLVVAALLLENRLWGPLGVPWERAVPGAALVGAAVALRTRYPVVAVAGALGPVVALLLLDADGRSTPVLIGSLLALAVLGYLAGCRVDTRRQRWTLGAVLGAASLVVLAVGRDAGTWLFFTAVPVGLCTFVPWLVGRNRRQQRELVRTSRERAEQAELARRGATERARLRERARIAEDMHDHLGHQLSLIAIRAGGLEIAPDLPDRHRAAVGELRASVAAATERLAEIVGLLRSDRPPSTEPVQGDLRALIDRARRSGMTVEADLAGDSDARPPAVAAIVHRTVREALTNAAKHAPGRPVRVRVTGTAEQTVVRVRNPLPADPSTPNAPGGWGLLGLREGAGLLGGTVEAGTVDGGFDVVARLPHHLGKGLTDDPGTAGGR